MPLCEQIEYKYIISLDGNASSWLRGPEILGSNSVPLIVESEHTPLYLDSWMPWQHYVPIKNDLSDLIEKIAYLRENDEKAKEIAQNG